MSSYTFAALLGLVQCQSASTSRAKEMLGAQRPDAPTHVPDAGRSDSEPSNGLEAGPPSATQFPGDWCEGLGTTDGDKLGTVNSIIGAYYVAQSMNCETAGLTLSMTTEQFGAWLQYLRNYTYLMAGCVPRGNPVEGGIRVFGPANTRIVGVQRQQLAPSEANLLVEYYALALSMGLNLTPNEAGAVRAFLTEYAAEEVDPAAARSLSSCDGSDSN
ncbi:MAG TPA: hypothetical protein VMG12_27620 [Polyangiaceae bacterium]|nr:hypothetical protein [Polyangiaceae bacterium]